ncbi:putative beta-defensin 109B [Mastomys coucha]|uniref:putative beta-defensin 109B n=1 Tax=Mastomys coucha TaxID=35658 RepID=UPI00126177A1|nr:putative beta-defensin 109B [Mastomys coucha]
MRLYLLLSTLVFLLDLLPRVRSGLGASEMHCTSLQGMCRRNTCKMTEDEIGACRRRWKCCRVWWILIPIPTPVIFSDYQEPLKSKIK